MTRRTSATMAETRSQALLKGTAARESEVAISSRLEALEKAIEMQNERNAQTEESVREMIETFKLMTRNNPMNPSTSKSQPQEQYRQQRQGPQIPIRR